MSQFIWLACLGKTITVCIFMKKLTTITIINVAVTNSKKPCGGSPRGLFSVWLIYYLTYRHVENISGITRGKCFDISAADRHSVSSNYGCVTQNTAMNGNPLPRHTGADTKWPPIFRWHFQMHFLQWKCLNFYEELTEAVPIVPINNIPALVEIMAWCRPGDKPSPQPMLVRIK